MLQGKASHTHTHTHTHIHTSLKRLGRALAGVARLGRAREARNPRCLIAVRPHAREEQSVWRAVPAPAPSGFLLLCHHPSTCRQTPAQPRASSAALLACRSTRLQLAWHGFRAGIAQQHVLLWAHAVVCCCGHMLLCNARSAMPAILCGYSVCMCLWFSLHHNRTLDHSHDAAPPSPTLSPSDPVPRGLLTLCPEASSGPQG